MGERERLLKIIDPIVRGQIKSFRHSHPDALRGDLSPSIAKRIINDLTCDNTIARLTSALLGTITEVQPIAGVAQICVCGGRDGTDCPGLPAPPDNPETEDGR